MPILLQHWSLLVLGCLSGFAPDRTAMQQQDQMQQLQIETVERKIEALLDTRNKIG
jgi:hypothetical protein